LSHLPFTPPGSQYPAPGSCSLLGNLLRLQCGCLGMVASSLLLPLPRLPFSAVANGFWTKLL
jgi:hypothetical protein